MMVIQLVPNLSYGDAVGNDVLAIDKVLKKNGYESVIYAIDIDERLKDFAKSFSDICNPDIEDIIIYHMATASKMSQFVRNVNCKKILRYHNITPPHFFDGYNQGAVMACQEGLREIKSMYDVFDYCIPDSEFNMNDLSDYGYKSPMKVLPVVIPFDDYRKPIDERVYEKYNDGKKNILFVGRFAPNKKWEDVIASYCLYKKYWNPDSRLIMVGKYDENDPYYKKLKNYIDILQLEDVEFTGHISFNGILACYKVSDLFLCLSEHEGFCVPIVEAMIFNKPIIAYDACAVPATMGAGTMVMKEKEPVEIAGMINYILTHEDLKMDLIRRQNEKLKNFEYDIISDDFLNILKQVINL